MTLDIQIHYNNNYGEFSYQTILKLMLGPYSESYCCQSSILVRSIILIDEKISHDFAYKFWYGMKIISMYIQQVINKTEQKPISLCFLKVMHMKEYLLCILYWLSYLLSTLFS